ncbi:alpha/beta fold hydrolase [Nocardioides sp. Bht2]|uniref:alpha/beta fold hydrolase n=1 Tax=Nocardioides sp. Bht2 TaxID=3392297 RepID=UPI0039B4294B
MRVRAGYVDTQWGQVHYRAVGGEGPMVALFHESPLSSMVYRDVLELLGGEVRVVAFDTPGYGNSAPPPRDGFEIPDYAAILAEAISHFEPTDLVVAGVHTGASLAVEVARLLPAQTRGVVASGIALFTPEERAEYLRSWAPQPEIDADASQFAWAIERYRRIWPGLSPQMLHDAVLQVNAVLPRYAWGYHAAFRHDPAPALAELQVPVLLLDAEHDLLAEKDAVALQIAQDARLVVLEGLAGQPHLRTPQRYAAELLAFVAEVAQ